MTMQARLITNFRWISLLAALLLLAGCSTTPQNFPETADVPGMTVVDLTDAREYFRYFDFSQDLMEELMASAMKRPVYARRSPEKLAEDIQKIASARSRVLSDIADYPRRRPMLEVAGGLLGQELTVLQICYLYDVEGQETGVAQLRERLQQLRSRHPELPGGAAARLQEELSVMDRAHAAEVEK